METERGWAGPVAILVAGVIMTLFHYARVWAERRGFMIDNPSPTTDDEWGAEVEPLVSSDVDIPLDWDSEGDVDLDELQVHGWGSISYDHRARQERMTLDDWIMDNLSELGFRQTVHRGALLYGVTPRTMTQRINDLKNAGFDL